MIDIENEVFTTVKTALGSTASMSADYQKGTPAFPVVTMQELDNSVYERTIDSGSKENHSTWACQFDVYSNLVSGKKEECKALSRTINTAMVGMGFVRFTRSFIPNYDDDSISRMVLRYRGVVDNTTKKVYRG
jgi:hypothetical protein